MAKIKRRTLTYFKTTKASKLISKIKRKLRKGLNRKHLPKSEQRVLLKHELKNARAFLRFLKSTMSGMSSRPARRRIRKLKTKLAAIKRNKRK